MKFSGRAVREIGEAFEWYEEQSQGLGTEFELAFELQLKRLEQVPFMYAEILPGRNLSMTLRHRSALI